MNSPTWLTVKLHTDKKKLSREILSKFFTNTISILFFLRLLDDVSIVNYWDLKLNGKHEAAPPHLLPSSEFCLGETEANKFDKEFFADLSDGLAM